MSSSSSPLFLFLLISRTHLEWPSARERARNLHHRRGKLSSIPSSDDAIVDVYGAIVELIEGRKEKVSFHCGWCHKIMTDEFHDDWLHNYGQFFFRDCSLFPPNYIMMGYDEHYYTMSAYCSLELRVNC